MNIVLYSNKIDEYLKHDNVIDYYNKAVQKLADKLFNTANNELSFGLICLTNYTANCELSQTKYKGGS